jgi:DNA-binding NtrC family response regulator
LEQLASRSARMPHRVLIVDDDPVQRRLLEEMTRKLGYLPEMAEGGEAGLAALSRSRGPAIDVMLLDLVMPDLDGMAVLERMRRLPAPPPVIVQTSQGGIDTAVSAMRAGAFDFLVKPAAPERVRVSIANALKVGALAGEIDRLKRARAGTLTFRDIVSGAPSMQRALDLGARAARSSIPVLIEGESGVGKELFARAIQGSGPRRSRPFVTVNCGAVPPNLVESVLFGHEKGAFTGAAEKHVGKFQEAHNGTLFLDEVGELPAEAQVKLLRALQEGEIDPVGARRPVRVDFRLIAATNRRLLDLVAEGRFREDLFYRLNVFPIWLPPLRDRREDIPELARHFLARFAAEEGKPGLCEIGAKALELLAAFDWPGNIRQLENAIFRAVILADHREITPQDLPQIAASLNPVAARERLANGGPVERARTARADVARERQFGGKRRIAAPVAPDAAPLPVYGVTRLLDERGEVRRFDQLEEETIRFALDHYRGRMSEVAKRLGIGRSTLYRKLKEYGIGVADSSAARP